MTPEEMLSLLHLLAALQAANRALLADNERLRAELAARYDDGGQK